MCKIDAKVDKLLSEMSFDEKIGQLFVVRRPQDADIEAIKKYKLGGFTLYAVDFEKETPDTVRRYITKCNEESAIPMFFAIDEEGGRVVRASKFSQFRSSPFKSPSELFLEGGIDAIIDDVIEKTAFLKDLGVNFNYAPVCDMAHSTDNFIFHRTLGQDIDTTCEYIYRTVKKMNELKIVSSLKHFPGYGDNVDTHTSIAHDDRKMDAFTEHDLLPFISGMKAQAPIIMVAHNIVTCMDPTCPASLSPLVNSFIRKDLKYNGIIMTDSLDMNAITLFTNDRKAAVAALLAGNDLLCCSSYQVQFEAVADSVRNGLISMERIETSLRKILRLKYEIGIIQ